MKINDSMRTMFNIRWSYKDIRSCFIEAAKNLQEQSGSQHIRWAMTEDGNEKNGIFAIIVMLGKVC